MDPRFSLDTVFHVRSVAPAGLRRWQLKRHQVALIDLSTNLTVPSAKPGKDKVYEFVWGSPNTGPQDKFGDQKGVKLPHTSQKITDVESLVLFDQSVRERKPFIGYLGYDGKNDCEGLAFKCGTNYTLDVTIKGEPVRKVFGQNVYFEQIPFSTGCCDDCSATATVTSALTKIREAFYQGNYAHKFVDLDTVISCCPVPDPFPKVDFFDYSVSLCDGGTDLALADVQAYYPTLEIKRSKYADGISTYTTECVLSAPANYVVRLTSETDCGDCPAGYTKTTAGKKYIVQIANAGTGTNAAQWLTEVQAAGAFSVATAANRIGRTDTTSIYEVTVPANFVEPSTAISNTTWAYAGPIEEYCRQTTASTFTWAQTGQSYKITRKLCATIKNPDCEDNTTVLAALTKFFATVPNIVANSLVMTGTNDCLSTYEVEQYSDCVVDGCDTVGADKAKFESLPSWGGEVWTMCACEGWTVDGDGCPVPPAPVDDPNCRGGLKFTGKVFDDDYIACVTSPLDAKQNEGVTVEVSIGDPSYYEGCVRPKAVWKVVQNPTRLNGIGFEYAKMEAASFRNKNICYVDPNSQDGNLLLGRSGEKPWTVDLEKFYHHISLYHKYHNVPNAAFFGDAARREQVMFVVEADKTELLNQVKSLVNSLASVQGITELV